MLKNETNPEQGVDNLVTLVENSQFSNQCKHCKEHISGGHGNFLQHVKSCEKYSKFFKFTSEGYECLKCPEIKEERQKIHSHINYNHMFKNEGKSDQTVDNTESEKENECKYCKDQFSSHGSLLKHERSCRYLFKYFKKSSIDYECLECPEICANREDIYYHVKYRHIKKWVISKSGQHSSKKLKMT